MSLNLIKYSSHLKENIKKKTFDFLTKFIQVCLICMLWLRHILLITLVHSVTLTLLWNYLVSIHKRTLTA